jgi:acetyltransferase-like isoleucine patch superfamily enzyme
LIRKIARHLALNHNKGLGLYKRLCHPSGKEWATYLQRQGGLYHLGSDCSILPSATIVDPAYTWIGDRVWIGTCTLICHDGSIGMLYKRYGLRIDRVAPIIIKDDVFVGECAVILGGTTIGEGSIVGAGAVLRQSVPAGSVVMGNPAKVVAKVAELIRFWEADMTDLPWADLIARREGVFDPGMEAELRRLRQDYFFKDVR